jgi:molybdopterin-guanine dinucleotide biosynthesis protein A
VKLDALVLAGGKAGSGDLLRGLARGGSKALLPIGKKPMAQWVVDALAASPRIARIVVVGLPPDAPVHHPSIAARLPDHGSLLTNILAGAEWILRNNPTTELAVTASGDIPAVTPDMVTWVVDAARKTENDLYYVVVPKEVMEARFPKSRRSFVCLRDYTLCGGDLHIIRLSRTPDARFWGKIHAARKSPLRQAALVGVDTFALLVLGRITLAQAECRVSRRIGLRVRALVSPYAELGMDVDTPHQYALVRNAIEEWSLTPSS